MTTSYGDELKKSGKIIFTIKGVSMRPLFRNAEDAIYVVTCNPVELKNLDIVLFNRVSPAMGEQYVLHRIVGRRNDGMFIVVKLQQNLKQFSPILETLVGIFILLNFEHSWKQLSGI